MEKTINKFGKIFWALLGITALLGAVLCRAPWHFATAGVCALMFVGHCTEDENNEE